MLGVVVSAVAPAGASAMGAPLFFLTSAPDDPVGYGADIQTSTFAVSRPSADRLRFATTGSPLVVVDLIEPTGTFAVGERWAGPAPVLAVSVDGRNCSTVSSQFKIDEVVMAGSVPSRIAVRFAYSCNASVSDSLGVIAIDATVPVYAATVSPKELALNFPANGSTTRAVTYRNVGPSPMSVTGWGSSSIGNSPSLNINVSGCTSVVAPGGTCTLSYAFEAANRGTIQAFIGIQDSASDDRALGTMSVRLTGEVSPSVGSVKFAVDSEANDPSGLALHDKASNFGQEQWIGAVGGTTANGPWFAALGINSSSSPPVGVVKTTSQSGVYLDVYNGTYRCPDGQRSGSYLVDEFAVSPTDATLVTRYSARFRQRCNDDPTAELFGSINLGSTRPFYSHEIAPKRVLFEQQVVGVVGPPQVVTIANDGEAPLAISSVRLGGADISAFSFSQNCPAVLNVGASCSATIRFTAPSEGLFNARLEVVDSLTNFAGDGASQDVVLSGAGVAAPTPGRVLNPERLDFVSTFPGSASQVVSYLNTGSTTLTPTFVAPGLPFAISNDSCSGRVIEPQQACSVTVDFTPTNAAPVTGSLRVTDVVAPSGAVVPLTGTAVVPDDHYVPVDPTRIFDTRGPVAGRTQITKLRPYEIVRIPVAGVADVPSSGVDSVAVNLTAVGSDRNGGYLTLYPSGQERPGTSNVNAAAGEAAPNMVIVAVGDDGAIMLANGPTTLDAIVDITGYFGIPPSDVAASGMHMLSPVRVLDTRLTSRFPAGSSTVQIGGLGGVPLNARAVVINATGLDATVDTFVTLFETGTPVPTTSTLNLRAGAVRPNLAIVELGPDGTLDVSVFSGSINLIIDVVAWLGGVDEVGQPGGGVFGLHPERIFDTRIDPPQFSPGTFDVLDIPTSFDGRAVTGVVLNVTVTNPSTTGFLTVFPGDLTSVPVVSNLNFAARQTIANLVVVKVPASGEVVIFNPFGFTDVIVDVMGLVVE